MSSWEYYRGIVTQSGQPDDIIDFLYENAERMAELASVPAPTEFSYTNYTAVEGFNRRWWKMHIWCSDNGEFGRAVFDEIALIRQWQHETGGKGSDTLVLLEPDDWQMMDIYQRLANPSPRDDWEDVSW